MSRGRCPELRDMCLCAGLRGALRSEHGGHGRATHYARTAGSLREVYDTPMAALQTGRQLSSDALPPTDGSTSRSCADVAGAFASVAACFATAECAVMIPQNPSVYGDGGVQTICSMSVADMDANLYSTCGLRFTPPAARDARISDLCAATCATLGAQ
eukprot:4917870-Prymnesium_polylepis.1